MCHHRTDWSRIASEEPEDEREVKATSEFDEEREVEDEQEEEPIPADD